MGDYDSPESSWKKMVISKSNNKWSTMIRSEQMYGGSTMDTRKMTLGEEQISICNIKTENEEESAEQVIPENGIDTRIFVEELNPLLMPRDKQALNSESPVMMETPGKRKRRKTWGPKCESPEERAVRLAKMSAYAAQRIANETPEQRALRLRRMSEYAAKRLSQETQEQRAKRLARMSAYAAQRLAKETPEQRQARLTRMSLYAARRHAKKKYSNNSIPNSFNSTHTHFMNNFMPDQS